MGIANIYILEKGTMIHHFVCVGHTILNLKKMVVLQIPWVAKTNLSFVKMTFMSRFQVLVFWRVESRVTDMLLDHKNKDLSKKTAWTPLIGWVTGHVRPKALYTNAKKWEIWLKIKSRFLIQRKRYWCPRYTKIILIHRAFLLPFDPSDLVCTHVRFFILFLL